MLQMTPDNTNYDKNRTTLVVLEWNKLLASHESACSNQMLSDYQVKSLQTS